jgi:dTDP-glucose pyrophosphorylase
MLDDISPLRVAPTATVREAIEVLSATGRQIVLVLDDDDLLLGVVTDGDVRRGLLRGITIDDSVGEVMNATPVVATDDASDHDLRALMTSRGIRHVPVTTDGRVARVYTFDDVLTPRPSPSSVVLMAGGRGERLRPLTDTVPKPMLPVAGVPMIEIILRNLADQGFRSVWISVNYLADVIIDHIGDGSQLGLSVRYLHEDRPLGTAGALAGLIDTIEHPFVVMNSDLLTQVNLRELLKFHGKQGSAITVGVREHVTQIPFGVVTLNGADVESIVEKPAHRVMVSAGIYAIDPSALTHLTADEYADMPWLLERVMESGRKVTAFPIHESWVDVGRPEDLDLVRRESGKWTG